MILGLQLGVSYLENFKLKKESSDYAKAISGGSYYNCDELIHEMSKYPHVVLRASISLQPHLIIYYLKDFAHSFHSFYNDNQVLTESKENIDSIVFCLNAAKIVIANGLKLLGIEPIEKM